MVRTGLWRGMTRRVGAAAAGVALLALPAVCAFAADTASPSSPADVARYNLQDPVTPVARQMYELHSYIMWICLAIFIGVFGGMFYSLIKHRRSVGHQAAH